MLSSIGRVSVWIASRATLCVGSYGSDTLAKMESKILIGFVLIWRGAVADSGF